MAIMDFFSKSAELLSKGVNGAKDAAKEKMNKMQEYNMLITASDHITGLSEFKVGNNDPQKGKEQFILNKCLTANVHTAEKINSLIPVSETIVDVKTAKESKTKMSYWFIITNRCLYIANEKEYKTCEFSEIKNAEIVNTSLMSQYSKFDNNAFVFDGSENDILSFFKIVLDVSYREEKIKEAESYLCGVVPAKQFLNIYMTGMTLGTNPGEIVFHGGKDNKRVDLKDISYIELLMDNTAVMVKGKPGMQSMISAQVDCRRMSIKVILTDNFYTFDVMPPNVMQTLVKKEDSKYIESYNFAKSIINTVEELLKNQ